MYLFNLFFLSCLLVKELYEHDHLHVVNHYFTAVAATVVVAFIIISIVIVSS